MKSASNSDNENSVRPPLPYGREREEELLELCASGNVDPEVWRQHGDGYFMAGLATLIACGRGFDRPRYLALAEVLHPGMTEPELFELWLQKGPVRAARFFPMLERRMSEARRMRPWRWKLVDGSG